MAAVATLDAPVAARPASPAMAAQPEQAAATASFGTVLQDACTSTAPAPITAAEIAATSTVASAELAAPAVKPATGAAVKAPLKPPTTLADLLATLPGSIVTSSEGAPAIATTPAPKVAVEAELPTTDALAPSQPAPDPFLNWLAAVKEVTNRLPTSTVAEAPVAATAIADAASLTTTTVSEALAAVTPDTDMALATTPAATPFAAALAVAPQAVANAPVAAPPPASLPLAMDTPDWPQRLGEQIQWRLGEGIQEARIEITPRDLGLVDVRLSMDDGGLRVHLSAAHAQTRELLQSELPRLREWLQQGGVQLADAQVGREAPGHRSHAEHGQAQQGRAQGGFNGDESESSTAVSSTQGWRQRRGLLDDYA